MLYPCPLADGGHHRALNQNHKTKGALSMARSKYPGIGLAAVKKFCGACICKNKNNRQEYAGLAEESGNYYLVDGFRMIRFRYDLPELIHAEKNEIGSQPSMLYFIENARQKCSTTEKSAEIELPALEEVKAAADMNKAAKKHKGCRAELPIPLAGGRIWVNPKYLLDMMQIFPMQRVAVMTGNTYQPLYFGCDGVDGILLPVNCKNPQETMEQWAKRKAQAEITAIDQEPQKKSSKRTVKCDNMGQPINLSQLKKRLTVGAAFEINTVNGDLQQRRVIKAQTNAIVSIVPFDADHKVTAGGGSWMTFESASDWAFSDGLCVYCGSGPDAVFSIRLIDTTAEEDERYNTWLADLEAKRRVDQERKEAERLAAAEAQKEAEKQEIDAALTAAQNAIHERGKRVNNDIIKGKCVVLRLAEKYGINVPLRTAGWISEHLACFVPHTDGNSISPFIWQGYKGKRTPSGVLTVLFAIVQAVDIKLEEQAQTDDVYAMTDEEFERWFFGCSVDTSTEAVEADFSHDNGQEHTDSTTPEEHAEMPNFDADGAIYKEYTADILAGGQENDTS